MDKLYFNRAFNQPELESTVRTIIQEAAKGDVVELLKTEKWIRLVLSHTEETIKKYEEGIDISGSFIRTGSEIWASEMAHFKNKRKRVQKALSICEKHTPFK